MRFFSFGCNDRASDVHDASDNQHQSCKYSSSDDNTGCSFTAGLTAQLATEAKQYCPDEYAG